MELILSQGLWEKIREGSVGGFSIAGHPLNPPRRVEPLIRYIIFKSEWTGKWIVDLGGASYCQFQKDTWSEAMWLAEHLQQCQQLWEDPEFGR